MNKNQSVFPCVSIVKTHSIVKAPAFCDCSFALQSFPALLVFSIKAKRPDTTIVPDSIVWKTANDFISDCHRSLGRCPLLSA